VLWQRQVLVVDDDPGVRDSVAMLLQSEGYNVTAAEDGFGALLQLRKVMPDVIVSDLNMPRMSGFELLALVRRRFPRIVLVAMSGAYRNTDELPREVIVDGFYTKGEHPKPLFETLRTVSAPSAPRSSRSSRPGFNVTAVTA
jgi:CheY-like chemotaxis protein